MQGNVKWLQGEEISKFSTLVRKQEGKLGANQLLKLQPHVYRDYIQKVKQYAGQTARAKHTNIPHKQLSSQISQKTESRPQRAVSAQAIRSTNQDPSYYYSKNLQIMSMKEFIVFLQQSKRKQEQHQRKQSRLKQKQFVLQVDRRIQSSHSQRNLRLTSSSARRISQCINRINYENVYEQQKFKER